MEMSDIDLVKKAILENEQFKKYSNYDAYAEVIATWISQNISADGANSIHEAKHPFYIVENCLIKDITYNKHQISIFKNLEDLLICKPEKKQITGIYLKNGKQKELIKSLIESCNGDFSLFVQQLPNLIGIHSNARIGTIKKASIEDIDVIIKMNSTRKPERFINEQKAIQQLNGLGITKSKLTIKKNSKESFTVRLLDYLAIIKDYDTENCYSVSKELNLPTAEEILIECQDFEIRKRILSDLTKLIDYFFKKGILWHDIAPRNILVKQRENGNEYIILDFERTKFQENVSKEAIYDFFRESFCIEEFSVICSSQEINHYFKKYYNPKIWNIEDNTPIRLKNPKKDYLEVLKRRGVSTPSQGEYDRFELENIKIRFPFRRLDEKIYPLHLSFKVNHFFDFFVDLDVMELMMYSKTNGCFYEIIKYFNKYMNKIDELLFVEDFLRNTGLDVKSVSEQKKSLDSQFLKAVEQLKKLAAKGSGFTEFIKNSI